ncbi:MBL fold metallo-hydrolase [Kitasatospora cheerisanensis]|nr:MBL fold metallo-hydrolase [Kitasatospora cheerisanensis]
MELLSTGRHHAAFAFGGLRVISLRDGCIDMPPTRLRDEHGCALGELPPAAPLAGDAGVFTGRLAPLRERVVPVSREVAINDWATAVPTPGHTPGHTVYRITGDAGRLLIWGDTVHVPTLQFDRPEVSWELDGDQPRARAARADLLEQLARPQHFVAGAHLDSPGIARVTPAGRGYALEYLAPPIG